MSVICLALRGIHDGQMTMSCSKAKISRCSTLYKTKTDKIYIIDIDFLHLASNDTNKMENDIILKIKYLLRIIIIFLFNDFTI